MSEIYDIFLSCRRQDLFRAQPLLEALKSAGLRVWRDDSAVDEDVSITKEIRERIASSKVLMAFYSTIYPLSGACREEIISAWLAAENAEEPPQQRVRIYNPEAGFDHIPAFLRDIRATGLPKDPSGLAGFAGEIRDHISSLDGVLTAVAFQQPPKYYGINPFHAQYFIGRFEEFWDLHTKLTANRIGLISGAYGRSAAQVRGLAGNGKTLLAREYAIRFGPAYPGGVFWLNAYGNNGRVEAVDEKTREALRRDQIRNFAFALGLPVEGFKPVELEDAFWRRIADRCAPCLWIVDDLPVGMATADIERHWSARWANASTLITTQSREHGSLEESLDLGVLSLPEAVELLTKRRRANDGSENIAARRITEILGYHPLALEVAGSYLAKGIQSFQQYLHELTQPQHDPLEDGSSLRENLPIGHDRSIGRTLFKSINLLGSEGLDFLCLASVLAGASIHADLVQEVFESAGYGAASREHVLRALEQLDSLSLCESAGENAWRVHTLISRAVRFRFRQSDWMKRIWSQISQPATVQSRRDERIRLLQKAVVRVLDRRLSVAGDVREHARIANEVAHARHLTSNGLIDEEDAALAGRIARHDYERGEYSMARKLEEQVLETRARLLGPDHPHTLKSMNNLAQMLKAQGDLNGARTLEEKVLQTRTRLLGQDHPRTLKSMLNLAQTLYTQGDLEGACKLEEQVLEARTRLLGPEHPDTLISMNNLAGTLYAQGDLARARKLEEQVLEAMARLLGPEHPDTLTSMNNLAQTLHTQGDLAGARKLQEQVLEATTRLRGPERPDTLTSMDNLVQTLKAQGDLTGARQLREQMLEARTRQLGGEQHGSESSAI